MVTGVVFRGSHALCLSFARFFLGPGGASSSCSSLISAVEESPPLVSSTASSSSSTIRSGRAPILHLPEDVAPRSVVDVEDLLDKHLHQAVVGHLLERQDVAVSVRERDVERAALLLFDEIVVEVEREGLAGHFAQRDRLKSREATRPQRDRDFAHGLARKVVQL